MATFVCMGAMLQCSFGMAPSQFIVPDPTRPMVDNKPRANIMDNVPMKNIMPFGMCQSMANPTVASATAAACGVLTPMPGGKELVCNMPALLDNCKLVCMYGGNISVSNPGHTTNVQSE